MIRFGDIYPDSWELSEKFQDATLVKNRLWKIYDRGRKIWIQTHPNSEFVHSYICTDQTVQYLCSNCSFNGRYSRAKLAELPSGEDGLFEYQEHFRKCRLPMILFAENEKTSNVKTNESASSVFHFTLNSENLHTTLNSEAFGLNSEAFDNVSTSESSRRRWGNVSDQECDDMRSNESDFELERTFDCPVMSTTQKSVDDAINREESGSKSLKNKNTKVCEQKNSRRSTSIEETNSCTDIQSPNSSERTITPLKYSEVVPIAIVDKQFADAVEVDRKWGYLNDLKIWVEVPGKTGKVYLYKTKKTELKCKKCRIGQRYSKVEVFKNSDGFQHLFEVSNHRKECEYDVKTLKRLEVNKSPCQTFMNDDFLDDSEDDQDISMFADTIFGENFDKEVISLETVPQSFSSTTQKLSTNDNFDGSGINSNLSKVINRSWKISDDEKRVWCESKSNSDLWYMYSRQNLNKFRCNTCHYNKRNSFVKLTVEMDGSNSLWADENHEKNCLREYGMLFVNGKSANDYAKKRTQKIENNLFEIRNTAQFEVKKRRCQNVLVDDCLKESKNEQLVSLFADSKKFSDVEIISSEMEQHNFVATTPSLKLQTYGDVYKKGAQMKHLSNALKITNRTWKLSKDGKRIWCQSKSNSDLWYLYSRERENRFRCNICYNKKRYSIVKLIVEDDGSNSLWEVDNHSENCSRKYGLVLRGRRKSTDNFAREKIQTIENDLSEVRNFDESEVKKRRCRSILVGDDLEESKNEEDISCKKSATRRNSNVAVNLSETEPQDPASTASSFKVPTNGDFHNVNCQFTNLAHALKVTDKNWKISDDGKRVWCQSKSNSDLWYMYSRENNRFKCHLCTAKKRISTVQLVIEADGSKSLWEFENHDANCLRQYGKICLNGKWLNDFEMESTSTFENDLSEVRNPVEREVRKRQCQSVLHNEEVKKRRLSVTNQNDPVLTTLKLMKYGDLYKTGHQFAEALKVTDRKWETFGHLLCCQSKLNSKLWYLYHLQLNERFRCYECCNSKRYSSVKYVIEKDGSKTLWSVENHGKECLKNYEEIREHLKKNNSIIKNFTAKQKILNDSLKNPGSSKLKNERKTIDYVNDENFDLPSLSSPEEPTLSSESTTPNQTENKTSLKNVKPRPIIFLANENIYLPENLWILPCTSKNIAKNYLFIISKRNSNFGSKLVLRGTFEATLIYCCPNCQNSESEVAAIVRFENGRIFVKLEENANHQNRCYKMDLRKTLSNEGKILVNKKN